jgi:hypothetical protein
VQQVDNNGYYQEKDEAQFYGEDDCQYCNSKPAGCEHCAEEMSVKTTLRCTPERYAGIIHDASAPSGRRKFIKNRNVIHANAQKKYAEDVAKGNYSALPASQVFVQCQNCGGGFVAKKADRKRGWARFCSKSCKAQ